MFLHLNFLLLQRCRNSHLLLLRIFLPHHERSFQIMSPTSLTCSCQAMKVALRSIICSQLLQSKKEAARVHQHTQGHGQSSPVCPCAPSKETSLPLGKRQGDQMSHTQAPLRPFWKTWAYISNVCSNNRKVILFLLCKTQVFSHNHFGFLLRKFLS